MRYRCVFETTIELDENNIKWTKAGRDHLEENYETEEACGYQRGESCDVNHPHVMFMERYLTMALETAMYASVAGDEEGTLAFGTARIAPDNAEPTDYVDTADYAESYFHEVYGEIGYSTVYTMHWLEDKAEHPVEGTE
jgi:hypothetical protein